MEKKIAEDLFENKGVNGKLKISQVMQAAMVTGHMLIMHQRARANHTNCCSLNHPIKFNISSNPPPPQKKERISPSSFAYRYIAAVNNKD